MIKLNGYEIKVGDRLWSVIDNDWVTVVDIHILADEPLTVAMEDGEQPWERCYTTEGKIRHCLGQVLFWDKVEITPPPKPKPKVKKWQALAQFKNGQCWVTESYWRDLEEVRRMMENTNVLRLIPESEREFEE